MRMKESGGDDGSDEIVERLESFEVTRCLRVAAGVVLLKKEGEDQLEKRDCR